MKPGFFKNEDLSDLGPHAQLLFAGLWTLADKKGRLDDRPRRIKAELFPFYEVDVDGALSSLSDAGFIQRYERDGNKHIQINNFDKHQNPHIKEAESTIPAPSKYQTSTGNSGTSPALTLNPIPLTLNPLPMPEQAQAVEGLCVAAWQHWAEYRKQIRKPLKQASIPAAQKALAAFGSEQQAVVEQSVAQGWTGIFPLKTGGNNATRQPIDNSAVGKVRRANEAREQRAANAVRHTDGASVGADGVDVRPPLDQ